MSKIDLGMDFQMPKHQSSQIKVLGIGGGGSNAVNYMFLNGITGVDFVICNTDAQALEASPVPIKIQLGATLTEGLGAGSNPDIGKQAAQESEDKITELLDANTKMIVLTAGMGGGTGTGAAPVIAEIAKEKGILTVGVVTNPFSTEGGFRKKYAEEGVLELKKFVDTLLIINNDKLIEVYGDLTFTQAFAKANEILNTATKGIAEVISQHLLVNIDLNDARKVLQDSGTAVMGQSEAEGENRAIEAVEGALDSPLLNDNDITGAKQVLLKIVTGEGEGEIRMSELSKIKNKIQEAAGSQVNIIEGIGIDPALGNSVSVTVIATGFEQKKQPKSPTTILLEDDKDLDKNSEIENHTNSNSVSVENYQQTLNLEDESVDEVNNEILSSKISDDIQLQDSESQNEGENKIIFEFNSENESDNTNDPHVFINSILDKKDDIDEIKNQETDKVVLELEDDTINDHEMPLDLEDTVLNTIDQSSLNPENMKVEAREREMRLRAISQQLRTPSGLTNLEDVPAFKRNNIDLVDDNISSSEDQSSTYILSNDEDDQVTLKENNSFLHDNVD